MSVCTQKKGLAGHKPTLNIGSPWRVGWNLHLYFLPVCNVFLQ